MLKVTIHCVMWPKLLQSFYTYFTTDLGKEAMELPYNVWYAAYTDILCKKIFKFIQNQIQGIRLTRKIHLAI